MTFNEYAKYLNEKERAVQAAVSEAFGTLEVPIEVDAAPSINIDLVEVSKMGDKNREFVVGNVSVNVDMRF